ncbi:MAG: TRAP transporter substrate-binding protein DctP [Cellvibrionaceae bacterium]
MKNHLLIFLLILITVFSAISNSLEIKEIEEKLVYELTYGSALSPNHTFSHADKDWMEYVEKKSQGKIIIKPFWSGTLISGDQSVFELKHGVTDLAMITPIYMRAGMQAIRAQTGFYAGAEAIETQVEVFHCLLRDFPIFKKELEGVKTLVVQGGTPSYVLTKNRKIESIDDLKGMRLRAPTALVPVVYALGGDPVLLPMGDVYPAFAKGIIDGVLTPEDTLKSMHLAEIGQYLNRLAMHRGGYPSRAISNKSWQKLPKALQDLIEDSGLYWEERIAHYILNGNQAAIEYGKEEGVEFISVGSSEQKRFEKIYSQIAQEDAKKLNRFGIDGVAIYDYVQDVINQSDKGIDISCR